MCRATNETREWLGSTLHTPAAGTVRPSTTRVAGLVVELVVELVVVSVMGDLLGTAADAGVA
jgi:hypothetical protein